MAVMNRTAASVSIYPHTLAVVDISMCRQMSEMRQFSFRKLGRLLIAPFKLIAAGVKNRSRTLYFVPSAPSIGGAVKDAWILLIARLWFSHRIYHCHSGGVGIFLHQLPGMAGRILRWIICRPTAVIKVSESAPDDDVGFAAEQMHVVPNCITDEQALLAIAQSNRKQRQFVQFLFIGLHSESKGFRVLLEAFSLVLVSNQNCRLNTIGSFNDPDFERQCRAFVADRGLHHRVSFEGPKFGAGKIEALKAADALVFPTHFECETFGLVVAESMAAGIPAVASDWSGLRDLIVNGESGYLSEVKSPASVAQAMLKLANDSTLREYLGQNARSRFIKKYSKANFEISFRNAMTSICTTTG